MTSAAVRKVVEEMRADADRFDALRVFYEPPAVSSEEAAAILRRYADRLASALGVET